jgi:nitrogen fixation/metabolism regulation signal transduction histidine kinase
MSWVTVIWSLSAGACLTLAFLQFIVWCKDRAAHANLVFALGAVAVAAFAGLELALMRAETPAQFGIVARWIHVPGWVLIVSIVAFVRITTKEEGLGMGLAIVRSVIEAHGGSIAAENAEGGGARFHFRLPIKEGVPQ